MYAFTAAIAADSALIAAEGAATEYAKAVLTNAAEIVAELAPNGVGKRGKPTAEQAKAMNAAKAAYRENGATAAAADKAVGRLVNVAALVVAHPDTRQEDREAWVLEVRAFVNRATAADLKAARETKAADPVKAVAAAAKKKDAAKRGTGKQTAAEKKAETPEAPAEVTPPTPAELGTTLTADYLKAVTALLDARAALETAIKSGKATVTKQQSTGRESRDKVLRAALTA